MRNQMTLWSMLAMIALGAGSVRAAPLNVCATTTDLADLVRQIGGEHVRVTTFAKGAQNAHHVEARPSFVRDISDADLFVQVGLGLEVGWAPVLIRSSRNQVIQPGNPGHLDASRTITSKHDHGLDLDRTMGDVHPGGNPHYLLDPVNALKVARALRDRLRQLRPQAASDFDADFRAFRDRLAEKMVGRVLSEQYDVAQLAVLYEHGKLDQFLAMTGQADQLGGWFAAMAPYRGTPIVVEHAEWRYFADRFGLTVVEHLEPKPGLPPTTGHLRHVVDVMKKHDVPVVFTVAYYTPRHARLVAGRSGASIAEMAHQVAARPGCNDYIATVDHNVKQVVSALRGR